MRAIRIHTFGDATTLRYEEVACSEPGAGEVRVKTEVIGVNYVDIYHRTGQFPNDLPITLGMEAAGVVDAVGPDVSMVQPGDRVVYTEHPGAYAEYVIVPAWKLVPLPEQIESTLAAAVMMQGLTAHYLSHSAYPIREGDTVLVHAAAGGVGSLLAQMAKLRGAQVIGTVSTEEKAKRARECGVDHVINYTEQDFAEEVKRITRGEGVHAVYDSVGKQTFEQSLNCLRPRGSMMLFGQASGATPPIDPLILVQKGSLFLTWPSLTHYMLTHDELMQRANDLFKWLVEDALKVTIDRVYPLAEAAEAHRYLESRKALGKVLLKP